MLKSILRSTSVRGLVLNKFHTTPITKLREIVVEKPDDKTTVIEAKYVPSPRSPFLLKTDPNSNKCVLCQLKLDIKHTDVLILNQFINSKGEVLRKQDIGICENQYTLIKNLIYMAQHAGLLPEPPRLRPRKPYEKLNTYYDEKTILLRKKRNKYANKLQYLKLGPIEKFRIKPEKGLGW